MLNPNCVFTDILYSPPQIRNRFIAQQKFVFLVKLYYICYMKITISAHAAQRAKEIDPTYYETHDFGEDFFEAEKNGTLIVPQPGENVLDAIKRYKKEQKAVSVTARVPAGIVNKGKERAAAAGIPWSSYVRSIFERAIAEPPQAEAAR
jgi:predicted DNA binding CopG/RHH family protein